MHNFDSVLRLAANIAAHFSRVNPPNEEMQAPLRHAGSSAAHARPSRRVDESSRYAELVTRAATAGIDGEAGDIAKALLALKEPLPWVYHYQARSPEEDLSDRIAFAELIGPDAPLIAPACRLGFTVMAENTVYPLHAHPAVELYLVVSGRAQWTTPTSDRFLPPGELTLHRSDVPHAMRTYAEPLLAVWSWSGDIDAPAVYI